MAVEVGRETSVRRIRNPDDHDMYVQLKVIDKLSVYDGRTRRVTEYEFRNDPTSGREVEAITVTGESGDQVEVEQIKKLVTYNGRDNGQETDWTFFGGRPPDHLEWREDKIKADNGTNEDVWVKVRRVVRAAWHNGRDAGQDMELRLRWELYDDYVNLTPVKTQWDDTDINPPWRLDPFQMIVDVSWVAKYLAVFYSGNRIAAIPMSKLVSDPTPIHDRPANGNWGSDVLAVSQLKLAPSHSVVYSPLKVTETPPPVIGDPPTYEISADDNFQLTTVAKSSALKKFGASSIPNQARSGTDAWYLPLLNGDGSNYYGPADDFAVDAERNVSVTPLGRVDRYGDIATPYAITSAGVRYYGLKAWLSSEAAHYDFWAGDDTGGGEYMQMTAAASASWAAFQAGLNPGGTGVLMMGSVVYDVDETVVHEIISYPAIRPIGPGSVEIEWQDSGSLSVPFQFYSKGGGLDGVNVQFDAMSISAWIGPANFPIPGWVQFSYLSFDFYHYHPGTPTGENDYNNEGMLAFPYSFSPTNCWRVTYNKAANTMTVHTPYGTFDRAITSASWAAFRAWMHVSNGNRTIQAYELDGVRKIFLDGAEWAPTGIAPADVQMVLMDVPLERIQELAPPPPPTP